jgi:hypothetical protein
MDRADGTQIQGLGWQLFREETTQRDLELNGKMHNKIKDLRRNKCGVWINSTCSL